MVFSYGKCQSCGKYGMNRCFWYCEADTEAIYMCPDCFTEFDNALAAVQWQSLMNDEEEFDSF